jgi:TRAP-type C4-dicarboxylate transport system permease small subunit
MDVSIRRVLKLLQDVRVLGLCCYLLRFGYSAFHGLHGHHHY